MLVKLERRSSDLCKGRQLHDFYEESGADKERPPLIIAFILYDRSAKIVSLKDLSFLSSSIRMTINLDNLDNRLSSESLRGDNREVKEDRDKSSPCEQRDATRW